jgi:hypothetical protein
MTRHVQADREVMPGITVRDFRDALDAIDAWRRKSLNEAVRIGQRVARQGNSAGFITALAWIASETISLLPDEQADQWRSFLRDRLTAYEHGDEVI